MNKEQLAAQLDGREYGKEITKEEEAQAKAAGLVVVFGYSDDNMELRGAIYDELGCYNGGTAYLDKHGLIQSDCDQGEDCPYFKRAQASAVTINAEWGKNGYSWTYKTDIPHATFEIVEDGEKFCRGIVFSLADMEKD